MQSYCNKQATLRTIFRESHCSVRVNIEVEICCAVFQASVLSLVAAWVTRYWGLGIKGISCSRRNTRVMLQRRITLVCTV